MMGTRGHGRTRQAGQAVVHRKITLTRAATSAVAATTKCTAVWSGGLPEIASLTRVVPEASV